MAAKAAEAGRDAHAELIHRLAQGLAVMLLRARHHHHRQHAGRCRLSLQRFFVAVVQGKHQRNRFAAILLLQNTRLDAAQIDRLGAGVEILRRRVEGLARHSDLAPLVILDHRFDGRRGGDEQTLRLRYRDVHADCAVLPLEVGFRHAIDIVRRHGCQPVALHEQQSPIAQRGGGAQRLGHGGAVVQAIFLLPLDTRPGALDLVRLERFGAHVLEDLEERVPCRLELDGLRLRGGHEQTGIMAVPGEGAGAGRLLRLDEPPV